MKQIYEVGDIILCTNANPLDGNDVAPPLKLSEYPINEIVLDRDGNQHLDVGLKSQQNYIRSYETKEELPRGTSIHWCHPSRFSLVRRLSK